MSNEPKTILVTGGFGFIGTNFVKYWRGIFHMDRVIVMDASTYAADPKHVRELKPAVIELPIDVCDQMAVRDALQLFRPDIIFHLAAETHVCRSLVGPRPFMETNIMGTFALLEEWRRLHGGDPSKPFIHVSTDEVFGELGDTDPPFLEGTPIDPRSPYAASKASSDLIALAYAKSYDMPIRVTNCSNNFGPHQHREKLIPASILRIFAGEPVRIYGNGRNVRDWIDVVDHVRALAGIAAFGRNGERYVIGGDCEMSNIEMVRLVHKIAFENGWAADDTLRVEYIADARPKDDRRYAVDASKLKEFGWSPSSSDIKPRLRDTIKWYLEQETLQ